MTRRTEFTANHVFMWSGGKSETRLPARGGTPPQLQPPASSAQQSHPVAYQAAIDYLHNVLGQSSGALLQQVLANQRAADEAMQAEQVRRLREQAAQPAGQR
jgi:hypothetical protein